MTITVENLTVLRDQRPVLRDLSATAEPGRITVVLGPNAAGKSTLLLTAIGSLRPARGSIAIDGVDVHSLSPRSLARRLAYVPQRPSVVGGFTVREVIELGRYALPPDARIIDDVIEQMDLLDIAATPFHALSVGQQQRVTLARAMAQLSPNGCLLLDEPTSAMDLRHVEQAIAQLRCVAESGATVLTTMHDLGAIQRMADDVWLLREGRLLAAGSVDAVLTPDRLEEAFDVSFISMETSDGRSLLAPSTHDRAPT